MYPSLITRHRVLARVLDNKVASDVTVAIAAAVLVGPLQIEVRALVVLELALARSRLVIVVVVVGVAAAGRRTVVANLIPAGLRRRRRR